jgi:hypothetical protein
VNGGSTAQAAGRSQGRNAPLAGPRRSQTLPETDIGKPKAPARYRTRASDLLIQWVSDGVRTRDPQDHNLVLCQLSYAHHCHRDTRD